VFNNYDIKKISAGVYEHNKASYNMFKRVGFNVEGFEKYHAFINGKFLHRYVLAIYNENI
jgi:RimJ/RimL family protein N-acetyltransferase